MGTVETWVGVTTEDLPAERILMAAVKEDYEEVFIVGVPRDGGDITIACTSADLLLGAWMLRRAARKLDALDDAKHGDPRC